jgi:hypothetical protein
MSIGKKTDVRWVGFRPLPTDHFTVFAQFSRIINRLDENQEMQMETPARRPTGHLEVDVVFEKLDASKHDS